jgi:hypothetical protein
MLRILCCSLLVLGLSASTTSCSLFRKKTVPVPAGRPLQLPLPQQEPKAESEPLPEPPALPAQPPPSTVPAASAEAMQSPAEPPKPVQKRATRPAAAEATEEPEPEPAAPQLQLGEVMPDQKRAEYVKALDQSLSRIRQALGELRGRTLNQEQTADLNRIRAFWQQAEEIRKTDPATAASLAERAETLARGLLQSVR